MFKQRSGNFENMGMKMNPAFTMMQKRNMRNFEGKHKGKFRE
jgi:hypothetical protein